MMAFIFILTVFVSTTAFAADGTWTVDGGGNWSATANWAGATVADGVDATATFPDIFSGDPSIVLDSSRVIGHVLHQDTGQALTIQNNTLTLDLTAGVPTIEALTRDITFTSILAGNDGLRKTGSGTLNLSSANTFSGNIDVAGGTFRVGNRDAGSLGGGVFADDIALAAGTTLWVGSSVGHTFTGTISGPGNLLKSGNSTMILSTNNTYTGTTTIRPETTGTGGGTLSAFSFNSITTDAGLGTVHLPSSSLGAPTTVANGRIVVGGPIQNSNVELKYIGPGEVTDRVIQITFNASRDRSINASGSGPITFVSDFISNGVGGSILFNGTNVGEMAGSIPVNGNAGVKKQGSGTWTLSGTNFYTGPTVVSQGALIGGSGKPFGTSAITISGGELVGNAVHSLSNNTVDVNGGTLILSELDCLGDTNRLDVTTGTVQIDFGIQDVVGSLWLGGIEQSMGTYGSSSSRAINKNDLYFSGAGVLYVGIPLPDKGMVIQLF